MLAGKIVSIISAVADNGVIGLNGGLPWHNPDDLKWFNAMTMGKTVIMGSKTFDAFPAEAMRKGDREFLRWSKDGFMLDYLIAHAKSKEVMIAGGAQLYAHVLENKMYDRFYIARMRGDFNGDTFFPKLTIGV